MREALRIVIENEKLSANLLQKALNIPINNAVLIVEKLIEADPSIKQYEADVLGGKK